MTYVFYGVLVLCAILLPLVVFYRRSYYKRNPEIVAIILKGREAYYGSHKISKRGLAAFGISLVFMVIVYFTLIEYKSEFFFILIFVIVFIVIWYLRSRNLKNVKFISSTEKQSAKDVDSLE